MTIFFASVVKNKDKDQAIKALRYLESLEHEIFHIIYNIDEMEIVSLTEEVSHEAITIINQFKKADIFIGDMRRPSQTLGFLIAYAMQLGMPSLYFYPEQSQAMPFVPLLGNPSRLISYAKYDEGNMEQILDKFLTNAEKKIKSGRITFVSTKSINEFIDKISVKKGLSKGETIRGILEKEIDNENEL